MYSLSSCDFIAYQFCNLPASTGTEQAFVLRTHGKLKDPANVTSLCLIPTFRGGLNQNSLHGCGLRLHPDSAVCIPDSSIYLLIKCSACSAVLHEVTVHGGLCLSQHPWRVSGHISFWHRGWLHPKPSYYPVVILNHCAGYTCQTHMQGSAIHSPMTAYRTCRDLYHILCTALTWFHIV